MITACVLADGMKMALQTVLTDFTSEAKIAIAIMESLDGISGVGTDFAPRIAAYHHIWTSGRR
jgi:hypothetical protein